LFAPDPDLKLPYTLQWNIALEQALGSQQTISASYIGSAGRRLLQSVQINAPNPSFAAADFFTNTATSDYHALQLQFRRRLSHGVQALASYTVYDFLIFNLSTGIPAFVRPDVVPGQPFYLFGSQYPGGKAFNPAAFVPPPTDKQGNALRQGNLSRNALRGFGAAQWDFAVHREFQIRESLKLQFRAEMFNVLNHPNFAPPLGDISNALGPFGRSNQTLGQFLAGGNVGNGGFSPLYQIGGPRSIQFGLKLRF
jgi:hypothetical protein